MNGIGWMIAKGALITLVVLALSVPVALGVILFHNHHVSSQRCHALHGVLISQPGLNYACIEQGKH